MFCIELENNTLNDKAVHNISYRCLSLCKQAKENVQMEAAVVSAKAVKKLPGLVFKISEIELDPLDNVDYTKVDS